MLTAAATKVLIMIKAVVVLSVSFFLLMILRLIRVRRKMQVGISPVAMLSMLTVAVSVVLYVCEAGWLLNGAYILILIVLYVLILKQITGLSLSRIRNRRLSSQTESENGEEEGPAGGSDVAGALSRGEPGRKDE